MDATDLIETLENRDVLVTDERGGTVSIGGAYHDAATRVRDKLDAMTRDERHEYIASTHDASVAATLADRYERTPEFVADYVALGEFLDDRSVRDTIHALVTLDYLKNGEPRVDGAPTGSLPIQGELIEAVVPFFDAAVLYVWRPDCTPCATVKSDLESLSEDGVLDGVTLFAVYGPDNQDVLAEQFEVVGAPTTLFVSEGTVDSRLIGAPPVNALESELEIIKPGAENE